MTAHGDDNSGRPDGAWTRRQPIRVNACNGCIRRGPLAGRCCNCLSRLVTVPALNLKLDPSAGSNVDARVMGKRGIGGINLDTQQTYIAAAATG